MDLLDSFKQKAEELAGVVNRQGGLKATIEGLRRQMAESDRRRAMTKARTELKQLERQISEMITAIGIQAVGLYKSGNLTSVELQPLCQHVAELQATVAQQEAELARLEAEANAAAAAQATPGVTQCSKCGKPLPVQGPFCPFCGAPVAAAPASAPAVPAAAPNPASSPVVAATSPSDDATPRTSKPFCANCGAALRPGAKFCAKCGQTV